MQEHQLRVVAEKEELDAKINKLADFLESETFDTLVAEEQERLIKQGHYMVDYSEVLSERIAAF